MNWLYVIVIAAIIGAAIGFASSNDDKEGAAVRGGIQSGLGCGAILLQLFIIFAVLGLFYKICSWLF